jgi:hypothetical protein
LDNLLNGISPSKSSEPEVLDDISFGQIDYQLINADQTLDGFLSKIHYQLDTISNESETTCFDINSIVSTMDESEDTNKSDDAKKSCKKMAVDNLEKKSKHKFEKICKKQSNKEAAIRYRQKKIKEKFDLFTTRDNYKKDNDDLKKKIEDIQLEINFVKNILVEMLLKKV